MIEHFLTQDCTCEDQEKHCFGKDLEITLVECNDNDVIEKDNKLFIIDEEGKEIGELNIKSVEGIEFLLSQYLTKQIELKVKSGKFPIVKCLVYQYNNLFMVRYNIEDYAVELAKRTTNLIEQLMNIESIED